MIDDDDQPFTHFDKNLYGCMNELSLKKKKSPIYFFINLNNQYSSVGIECFIIIKQDTRY